MKKKAFGNFTKNDREYIINDAEAPPRAQINFLWNDYMISGHNQFGSGEDVFNDQAILLNDPRGRVRMLSKGRRYFYLLDRQSGEFWSAGLLPAKPQSFEYKNRVGLGYSVYEMEAHGILCKSTVYLAADEPVEIWEFDVINKTGVARDLVLVPYVEWGLGGYTTFSSRLSYLRSYFKPELKAVLSSNSSDERPHDRYNAFVATDGDVHAWCGGARDFMGPYGNPVRPKSLVDQKMSCKEAWCETLAGSMMIDLGMEANGSRTVNVLLGSYNTEKEATRLINRTLSKDYRKSSWDALRAEKDTMINKSIIHTPDDSINRIVNIWAKQQIQLCAEFGRDGARGFRDTLQDAWGILPFNPKLARSKIIETLSHQYQSGRGVRGWMPLQDHNYTDGPTWIAPTVIAYLKETGDLGFLDTMVPFLDGGEASVVEHMLRGVRYLSDGTGAHGLVLAHDGDWNDSLNWMGRNGKGESVWTSMSLFHSLNILTDLFARVLKNPQLATEMQHRAERIETAITEHGWDGEWYLAGYSDFGNRVGSKNNEEGKLFLNSQTWGILTGLAKGKRKEACFKAIDNHLESLNGSLTLTPAYTKEDLNVGRVSVILPGMYENSTPYCHGTAFKIVADFMAGRPNEALKSYRKVMPDNAEHPSTVSGCEPYAFTNQYLGPDNARSGQSISGWITGTAGWMYRAILEYMVGIVPDYDGFYIKPCLPEEFEEVSAERELRGKRYAIHVSKKQITVNGEILDGNFVSY